MPPATQPRGAPRRATRSTHVFRKPSVHPTARIPVSRDEPRTTMVPRHADPSRRSFPPVRDPRMGHFPLSASCRAGPRVLRRSDSPPLQTQLETQPPASILPATPSQPISTAPSTPTATAAVFAFKPPPTHAEFHPSNSESGIHPVPTISHSSLHATHSSSLQSIGLSPSGFSSAVACAADAECSRVTSSDQPIRISSSGASDQPPHTHRKRNVDRGGRRIQSVRPQLIPILRSGHTPCRRDQSAHQQASAQHGADQDQATRHE